MQLWPVLVLRCPPSFPEELLKPKHRLGAENMRKTGPLPDLSTSVPAYWLIYPLVMRIQDFQSFLPCPSLSPPSFSPSSLSLSKVCKKQSHLQLNKLACISTQLPDTAACQFLKFIFITCICCPISIQKLLLNFVRKRGSKWNRFSLPAEPSLPARCFYAPRNTRISEASFNRKEV